MSAPSPERAVALPPGWVCRPAAIATLLRQWAAAHPGLVTLTHEPQYCGHRVWAATVTGPGAATGRAGLLGVVPHAHEPGGTAASMDFLSQLITGRSLSGAPGELAREAILQQAVVTLIPAGNPDGLARAPLAAWDGTVCTNEEFWKVMKGTAADGVSELPWASRFDAVAVQSNHPRTPAARQRLLADTAIRASLDYLLA